MRDVVRDLDERIDSLVPVDETVSAYVRMAYKLQLLFADGSDVKKLPKDTLVTFLVNTRSGSGEEC